MGRPLRIDWHAEDTPEALKVAYQAERDVGLRTRLHGLWLCGLDGKSVRRQERWESTTGRYRRGWAGIEREGWKECCPTRWEGEVNRAF